MKRYLLQLLSIALLIGTVASPLSAQVIFVASLSGQLRLAKNFGLITENYLFRSPSFGGGNASFPLGSIGMRYMSDNFSFDLGINNLRLPVLGFSVPFGRKK
jgi:hypothetical protein